MPRNQLLNNIDHQDLRIITRHGAEFGDALMSALTFPGEFRSLQAHYPIVFRQSAGGFLPLALLGFQEGQNLFLSGERWDASYLPMTIERQPFLIGNAGGELMIHVDMDSPRISRSEGEAVFLPHGGSTEFIERINSLLLAIHQGIQTTPAFIQALVQLELLESFVLDIDLGDGSQNRLAGFHTINEERLEALPGGDLERLARAGHLQPIYMAIASLSNFRALIERYRQAHASDA
ncbi:MAG: SapC family protein [Rhodanobacteraceae bacterium]|nr:SapC family protein [Rhodanobacteraceae bacterium]